MSSARPGETLILESPLFVWDDARLSVAGSPDELVRAVAPDAVANGAIVVHDARGKRVVLVVERTRSRWLGLWERSRARVVVAGLDSAPVHADVLAQRLGAWLEARGVPGARGLPLEELVRRAAREAAKR
jgi:hypothetical protein